MLKRLVGLVLVLLLIGGCVPSPTPTLAPLATRAFAPATRTPRPTRTPKPTNTPTVSVTPSPTLRPSPTPATTPTPMRSFLPLVARPDDCRYRAPKKGVAYSYPGGDWPRKIRNDLCIADRVNFRQWSPSRPAIFPTLNFIPTLWSDEHINYFTYVIGHDYGGYVLVANEPDLSNQANMTAEELANLFAWINGYCPNCRLIGPGYSSAETESQHRRDWWYAYLAEGGNPDAVVAWDAHQYIEPEAIPNEIWDGCPAGDMGCAVVGELERRLDIIQAVMPVSRPIVVSEVGTCFHWPFAYEWMRSQLEYLEVRQDVLWYAVFMDGDYWPFQPCAYYIYGNDGRTGELNEYGRAIREVGW